MNYYQSNAYIRHHRAMLEQEAEQERLVRSVEPKRRSLLAAIMPLSFRIEFSVGKLAHGRLQWGTSETKVNYDPIPNCG
jgi:hypothetical protein